MKTILLPLLLLPLFTLCQTEYIIPPELTDPNSNDPDFNHYVYIDDSGTSKDKLFVFLPGTGGRPFNYRKILKAAANFGYHSIGLAYPNSIAINILCGITLDTTCHSRARLEIFDGEDRHNGIDITPANSIQNRLLKLLQYLNNEYPDQNWEQYFDSENVLWEKVIISGHSQGGGHAGIIGKIKEVTRVAMFASNDRIPLLNRSADWLTWESATAEDQFYGFTHESDEAIDFENLQVGWMDMNLFDYGDLTLVDDIVPPFNNSRTLFTQITPAFNPSKFHNAVVVDLHTPMANGEPVLLPVWEYLMNCPNPTTSSEDLLSEKKTVVFPNPFKNELTLEIPEGLFDYYLTDISGQILIEGTTHGKINTSQLLPGIYFLGIRKNSSDQIETFKLIKTF